MASIALAGLFGFFGGLLRSIIGILKLKKVKKEFNLKYLLTTLILSAVIGSLVALAFSTNNIFYLAVGYAGTDLLQGLVKIRKK